MHKDQLLLLLPRSFSIPIENNRCTTSCGKIANISYPFRLKDDPEVCGDPNYELACINNRTVLDLYSSQYHVSSIDYTNYTIRVVDVELQKGNCSSLPLRSLSCSSFLNEKSNWYKCGGYWYNDRELSKTVSIVNCTKAVASQLYIDASSCLDGVKFSKFSSTRRQLYAMVNANVSNMESACTIEHMAMIPGWADGDNLRSYAQIHDLMVYGFELSWHPIACKKYCKDYFRCDINDKHQIQCIAKKDIALYLAGIADDIVGISHLLIGFTCYKLNLHCEKWIRIDPYLDVMRPLSLFIIVFQCMVVRFILGAPCVMTLLIRKWRRRHLAMDQNVEEFLQSNNLLPIRYSYSDIRKITSGLKDKLGEGGYGSVFKGRLRSGREVAVKILKKGKMNGQDFISEVATIGRIHHVNVVGLIGYCFEGSKQGLVYDFMHNGSLDKHIFSQGQGISLECKEVYEIALGVARGIEYLHRGCDIQILHFDCKGVHDKNYLCSRNSFSTPYQFLE